jgi:hypothetical protein
MQKIINEALAPRIIKKPNQLNNLSKASLTICAPSIQTA